MSHPGDQPLCREDQALLAAFRQHSRRALARLITRIDNGEDPRRWIDALGLAGDNPSPKTIGVTGPPGAGKSSLIGALIPAVRRLGKTVAVLAVDPESPFTGGAILGDRIRMRHHHTHDDGVFIRSISTRGAVGGISRSTRSICRLIDAFGFDAILLETVGAGQAELSIMDAADLVLLTLVPGTGDTIQWEKAGQVEIADLFALNKADLPGIDALESTLRAALDHGFIMSCPAGQEPDAANSEGRLAPLVSVPGRLALWEGLPPMVRTVANQCQGIDELLSWILEGLRRLEERPDAPRSPVRRRLRAGLEEEFQRRMRLFFRNEAGIEALADQVRDGSRTLEEATHLAWREMTGREI